MQTGPFAAHRRVEEGRDEVVVAAREFALDEGARDLEVGALPLENIGVVRAAIDDLHVVDREDRHAMRFGVEVAPGLEVADDQLRREGFEQIGVGAELSGQGQSASDDVGEQGLALVDAVVSGNDVQAVDAMDGAETARKEVGRARRGHHVHLVAGGYQMVEDDLRADRMAHAFTDDTVENLHTLPIVAEA